MKTIYLAILLLVPVVANAQRIDKPNEPYDFYCCVSNSVIYTTVRMGEEKKLYILLKEDGSKVKNEYEVYYKTFMSKGGIRWKYWKCSYI